MTETTTLRFTKYEGLGNDFLVVDAGPNAALGLGEVERLCDRHFGVGGDGVLLVGAPNSVAARASMVVLNADGSRPEMCGNGLRCVALHLALHERSRRASFVVDTDAGPREVAVERSDDAATVAVSMGRAEVGDAVHADFGGRRLAFRCVSMGNPHAVCFDSGLDERALDELGPGLSARFPSGSNVELVTMTDPRAMDVIVWERGVGRTLACGTGACAAVAAAAAEQRAPYDREVEVRLPGGALTISVARETRQVSMRGPARRVFSGEVRFE